jgi:signal transduction histidine kinase
MDTVEKKIMKGQKRGWILRILLVCFVGLLTASVVSAVFFYSDLRLIYDAEQVNVYLFYFLLSGFVIISLLFMGYLALKELASKKMKTDLVRQKRTSRGLERRITELEAVHELTSLVNSEKVLSEILDTIARKALRTLGADQSSLFLFDPQIGKLRCVSVWGPKSDSVKNAVVEVGKSVAGWVMKNGKSLHLDEDLNQKQFADFIKKDKKITSSLCIPLMVKSDPRGVLNITLFDRKKKLRQSDLKLASIFAENAAIAVDKAGLYDRLRKQSKTLKNVISELKATQDRLMPTETLKTLSNLTSGMSRDFNKILSAIQAKVQTLLRDVEEVVIPENTKQNLMEWLKGIENLATEGAETAKHIQRFASAYQSSSVENLEPLDINSIVREVVENTQPKWKNEAELKGITIEVLTQLSELPSLKGNRSEIKEVLASMLYNSIDVLPDGGQIRIATKAYDDKVEIKVIDNGSGMSEQVKNQIFEPFFTTKQEQGHGIGLSVAYGIISKHNGEIAVESQPGEGTTFTITLPVSRVTESDVKKDVEITTPAIS